MVQIVLVAVIVLQNIIFHIERRDMLNRIMCKDINEYRKGKNSPPKHIPSAHNRILNRWKSTKKAGEE